ncbi:MAG: phosphotransferase enzyme family protein [Pseudonocardiaceae bacterium]
MTATATGFALDSTWRVLQEACFIVGLSIKNASPVRLGENSVYQLHDAMIVIRISRSAKTACKEVDTAKWLASHNFPAARLADLCAQPLVVYGFSVTFWELITASSEPVTSMDLGRMLRMLHSLPEPTQFRLPRFSPLSKVVAHLRRLPANMQGSKDVKILRARHHEIKRKFARLQFALPCGPIHGDAHVGNLIRSTNGEIKLIDFEDFSHGPREWDVSTESIRHQKMSGRPAGDYRDYTTAYGFDPLDWSGFPILRAARELNMATWVIQQTSRS